MEKKNIAIIQEGSFDNKKTIEIIINGNCNCLYILEDTNKNTLEKFYNRLKELQLFGYKIKIK